MYANGNAVPQRDGVSVLFFLRKNVEYLLQFLHVSFTTFPLNYGILTITEEQPLYQRYAGIFFLLPPFICETYVSKTVVPPGRLFYFALFPIPTKYAILKKDYSFPEDGKMPLIFHAADLHIGARFEFLPPDTAKRAVVQQLSALRDFLADAGERHADAVLIAGDLFDTPEVPKQLSQAEIGRASCRERV